MMNIKIKKIKSIKNYKINLFKNIIYLLIINIS